MRVSRTEICLKAHEKDCRVYPAGTGRKTGFKARYGTCGAHGPVKPRKYRTGWEQNGVQSGEDRGSAVSVMHEHAK